MHCLNNSSLVYGGVRQGSCLSPAIFNVFINIFIKELRKLSLGCHICGMFLGCLVYADDIILLSPSEVRSQVYKRCQTDTNAIIQLLEKTYKAKISSMLLGGHIIAWCVRNVFIWYLINILNLTLIQSKDLFTLPVSRYCLMAMTQMNQPC